MFSSGIVTREYLEKYSELPTLTIAKLIVKENPTVFKTVEAARTSVRLHRGEKKSRKVKNPIAMRSEEQKIEARRFSALPKTDYDKQEVFNVPAGNNRILVLNDIHFPYHDEEALSVALDYGIEHKANAIILNGDTIDMYQASRFIRDRRLRDIAGELEMTRQFLELLKNEFNCPIYFKIGNHEDRYENYLKVHAPELIGIDNIKLENILRFGQFGVQLIKSKQLIKAGKLNILHGHEFGQSVFSPVNAARGLYTRAKASTIIGHHHQTSEHSEKDLADNVVTTWSIGCLCGLSPEYLPFNKWNHGFGFINVEKNGDFQFRNLRIINGKAI
jgi:predicted phosphodiesterase